MVTKAQREEWMQCDFVRQHYDAAIRHGADEWVSSIQAVLPGNLKYCGFESPLEMAFYAWWHTLGSTRGFDSELAIEVQKEVQINGRKFRVDMEVTCREESYAREAESLGVVAPRVAIELDGHDFHERTREQVALRDERDRALQSSGWRVFHLSGSAFHRDPCEMVWKIALDAGAVFWDFKRHVMQLRDRVKTPDVPTEQVS